MGISSYLWILVRYVGECHFIKISHMRPDWDEYFFGIMEAVSQRATCDRGKAGAIIVRDDIVIATGYVGAPSGFDHCDDVGHQMKKVIHLDDNNKESEHCVRTIHAEQNAMYNAAKVGVSVEGATIYVKMTPCRICSMMIIAKKIKKVVCQFKYQLAEESISMLTKANVEIVHKSEELVKYENEEEKTIKFLGINRINNKAMIYYRCGLYMSRDVMEKKSIMKILSGRISEISKSEISIKYLGIDFIFRAADPLSYP